MEPFHKEQDEIQRTHQKWKETNELWRFYFDEQRRVGNVAELCLLERAYSDADAQQKRAMWPHFRIHASHRILEEVSWVKQTHFYFSSDNT